MSQRYRIATDRAPGAIGPYSQAIVAHGVVYCSGQIPLDPQTMTIVEGDIDGNGTADFQIALNGLLTLGAGDFIL